MPRSIAASMRVSSAAGALMCGPYSARVSSTRAAAARPLRTALSIVAGQPVSVHVPARTTSGRAVSTPGRTMPGRSAIVA